jgi:hypothetical protein
MTCILLQSLTSGCQYGKLVLYGPGTEGPLVLIGIGDELSIIVAGGIRPCGAPGALHGAAFVEKWPGEDIVDRPGYPFAITLQL